MKYTSIDIETTGLDPSTCELVQIGIVLDNLESQQPLSELPTLNLIIKKDYFRGHPKALAMHSKIFENLYDEILNKEEYKNITFVRLGDKTYSERSSIIPIIKEFLYINKFKEPINIAGKNFGMFDYQFLKNLPYWETLKFNHRVLDPAILYMDSNDEKLPDLTTCLKRVGIDTPVVHDAVADAKQVIQLIRLYFNKRMI